MEFFITAPFLSAFQQGVGMTRRHGTCTLVGLPPGEFPLPVFDVVAKRITVRGSFCRYTCGYARSPGACFKPTASPRIPRPQPLNKINEVFDRLRHGKVQGRIVLDFEPELVGAGTGKVATSKTVSH